MERFVKVSGSDTLVRDMESGAIVNVSTDEYNNYKRKIGSIQDIKTKLKEQDEKISELKSDISEIKNLLLSLLTTK